MDQDRTYEQNGSSGTRSSGNEEYLERRTDVTKEEVRTNTRLQGQI